MKSMLVVLALRAAGVPATAQPPAGETRAQTVRSAPFTTASAPVSETPAAGGVVVWYLGHYGYAVRTAHYLPIFDHLEKYDGQWRTSAPPQRSLAKGWGDPAEIKTLEVRRFVTHDHDDHFDPVIFNWWSVVRDLNHFFDWKVADNTSAHCMVGPRAELKSDGLEIATNNPHQDGIPEAAWLVEGRRPCPLPQRRLPAG